VFDKANKNIHTPDDGRGLRKVFLNGKLIPFAFCADTRKGTVEAYRKKNGRFIMHKYGKRVLTKKLYGKVEVI
jgi:hypothetical protein